jgi:hypothetical protein
MEIIVGNIKNYGLTSRQLDVKHFYIGRSGKGMYSPLGNPFSIGRDGTREEVVEKYRIWLWDHIQKDTFKIMFDLKLLLKYSKKYSKVVLICFCAPELCHGDVLVKCIKWMSTQEKYQ